MSKSIWIILVSALAYCASELIPIEESPTGRIVNGNQATTGQFPWQVSVQSTVKNGTDFVRCSGALISSNRVLTAAHCTRDYQTFRVGLGSTNIDAQLIVQVVDRAKVVVHPSFNFINLNYDISIILLNNDVSFTSTIQAIRLPRRAQAGLNYFAGQEGQIAGWGRISDSNNTLASNLRYATIRLFTNDICQSYYGANIITNYSLCGVGKPDSRTSPCSGDSGAPLAWRDPADLVWSVIGVFSFVSQNGCAAGNPSGYTNVASYLDWISANTGIIIRN